MIKQSDSLQQLVASTTELRKLEETIQTSVERLENVGRIEQATNCVGEAVAVLATCLERTGVIRGAPIRPRMAHSSHLNSDEDTPSTIPLSVADAQPKKKSA